MQVQCTFFLGLMYIFLRKRDDVGSRIKRNPVNPRLIKVVTIKLDCFKVHSIRQIGDQTVAIFRHKPFFKKKG